MDAGRRRGVSPEREPPGTEVASRPGALLHGAAIRAILVRMSDQNLLENRILRELVEDLEAGHHYGAEHYVARFPEAESLVRSQYAHLFDPSTSGEHRSTRRASSESDLGFTLPSSAGPGQTIGPFEIEEELGRGGQAVVYRARDTRLHRDVALKVLRVAGSASLTDALARFHREAEAASKLDHPAICPIHEIGRVEGDLYIAMRLIRGKTLSRLIRDASAPGGGAGPLARGAAGRTPRILEWFATLAEALHSAHERGILHRDVKPANIMISERDEPVILDFGLATDDSSTQASLTETGAVMGTPAYMAPEQIRGIGTDARTDVYGLGATLYETLTLTLPFEARTREALYRKILGDEPSDVRTTGGGISGDLAAIVEVALSKESGRRYETSSLFAQDLRNHAAGRSVVAKPASAQTRLFRWARRHPAVAVPAALTFLFLAVGLGYAWRKNGALEASQARTVEQRNLARSALAKVNRLADVRVVEELESWAARLWPALPEVVPSLDRWLREAATVVARFPSHRANLDLLRRRALPYSEEHRVRDHAAALYRLERMRAGLAESHRNLEEERSRRRKRRLEDSIEHIEDSIKELEAEVNERRSWDFQLPQDDWMHAVLSDLVQRLERFVAPEGALASVRKRREFALRVRRETVALRRDAWDEARRYVKTHPPYRDLARRGFAEQVGLVPLGRDRDSGLLEFLHLATHSGPMPTRDDAGRLVRQERTGVVLVLLPGGETRRGAQSRDPGEAYYDPTASQRESPVHPVVLSPFFLSKYELTQGQWMNLTSRNPSELQPGNFYFDKNRQGLLHPVGNVSWFRFDEVLRQHDLMLPTEAQWEYGCRAGTTTRFFTGETVASLVGFANVSDLRAARHFPPGHPHTDEFDDGWAQDSPTGALKPNAFGLHDVHGNVAEWCLDWFTSYDAYRVGGDEPSRPRDERANYRVYRGGLSAQPPIIATSAVRMGAVPDTVSALFGTRPAREVR